MTPIEMEYRNRIQVELINPKGEWTFGIQWFNYGVWSEDKELQMQQEKCIVISMIIIQIKIGRVCKEVEE